MKKITSLIIGAMLCLLLVACSNNITSKKYESFICDYANDGFISSAERDWWLKGYEIDSSAPAEKQVTFDGSDYYSVYIDSFLPNNCHNRLDRYSYDNDNITLYFDSASGKFSGIFFSGVITENYDKADIEESYDKALDEAKLLALKYIDLDEYILKETEDIYYKDGNNNTNIGQFGEGRVIVYNFTFLKKLNDFDTSDYVVISITSKGDLHSFHVFDSGLFSEYTVPEIDKDKLRESIDEKLEKIYPDYKYSYEIVRQTLTLSQNEKAIVVSQIELDIADMYRTGIILETEVE